MSTTRAPIGVTTIDHVTLVVNNASTDRTREVALSRSSRAEQLESLLERGVSLSNARSANHNGLRVAGV